MIKFLLKVVILAAAFYFYTRYLSEIDFFQGVSVRPNPDGLFGEFGTYLWLGLIFGVVNAIVGPLLRLLSLPFLLITLGLFLLIINAALLGLTAAISDRLDVAGFGAAVIGGTFMALAGWVADQILDR